MEASTANQDARAPSPPPPPRTKWTRRAPHPVLIGHAASLSQVAARARMAAVNAESVAAYERMLQNNRPPPPPPYRCPCPCPYCTLTPAPPPSEPARGAAERTGGGQRPTETGGSICCGRASTRVTGQASVRAWRRWRVSLLRSCARERHRASSPSSPSPFRSPPPSTKAPPRPAPPRPALGAIHAPPRPARPATCVSARARAGRSSGGARGGGSAQGRPSGAPPAPAPRTVRKLTTKT